MERGTCSMAVRLTRFLVAYAAVGMVWAALALPLAHAQSTPTPGANDCCQCDLSCGPALNHDCGVCPVVYGAVCANGACVPFTATPTSNATVTPTSTPTSTTTNTPTITPTGTETLTPTETPTSTVTLTVTVTPTPTVTPTAIYCCEDHDQGTCGPPPTPGQAYCLFSAVAKLGMTCPDNSGVCVTVTPTVTRTPTPTLTATKTLAPVCTPNGHLDVSDPTNPGAPPEQCDDGNTQNGDTCPSDCRYTVPGPNPRHTPFAIRGSSRNPDTDKRSCQLEWFLADQPNVKRDNRAPNLPSWRQECKPGDPCHPGSTGKCVFRVVLCLNNRDASLKKCTPQGIQSIDVLRPLPEDDLTNLRSLDIAAGRLLDPSMPYPTPAPLCPIEPCEYPYVYCWPLPRNQVDLCSEPFPIEVALGQSVLLKVKAVGMPNEQGRRTANLSKLALTCKPQ